MDASELNDFVYNVSSTAAEIAHDTRDALQKKINVENRVNSISISMFNGMISHANEIAKRIYAKDDLEIYFNCPPISSHNVFWRLTLTIRCTIGRLSSSAILSQRILNLRQFDVLYQEIKHFAQLPTETPNEKQKSSPDDVCLLCYDARPSSILPCGHNFCRKCIDEWFKATFRLPSDRTNFFSRHCPETVPLKNRQQCPLCRGPCPRNTEAWDLLDHPDPSECRNEMATVLLNLIYNAGAPAPTSASTPPSPSHCDRGE